ncbi:hypothetical protein Scep_017710 [Stephania cephalantha]|uniref:Uncharacterized protein n=1 Tax=Stephania cephalantha TaxID=152367 RepID=A0AAP0NTU5_9MAGN
MGTQQPHLPDVEPDQHPQIIFELVIKNQSFTEPRIDILQDSDSLLTGPSLEIGKAETRSTRRWQLKQEIEIMGKYAGEGCKNNILTAIIQNYTLVDMRVGRLEQNINSQGSELKREVAQVKLQVTQGNRGSAEQTAPGGALATLRDMKGGSAEHNS